MAIRSPRLLSMHNNRRCAISRSQQSFWRQATALVLLLTLSGCGGSRVLDQAQPIVAKGSLAAASDGHLAATLDWIIYQDGPGTWATNADWDEYMLCVRNLGDAPVRITRITVFDSLGTRTEAKTDRRQLVEGSKETRRRYNDHSLQVGSGWRTGGAGHTMATSMGTGAVVGAATLSGMFMTVPQAAATGAVAGGVIVLPALAASGVVRGLNHGEVDEAIRARQTLLPATLQVGEERNLRVFFPITPSPRRIEIVYADSNKPQAVTIDTVAALQGLHLAKRSE